MCIHPFIFHILPNFFLPSLSIYKRYWLCYNSFTIATGPVEPGQDRKVAAIRLWFLCAVAFLIMNKKDLSEILDELYRLSQDALAHDEVPVSCCLVLKDGTRYYERNRVEELHDSFAHAEFLALARASKETGSLYLKDSVLIVTLEPCLLCMGALLKKGISSLFYVLDDEKLGSLSHYHAFVDDRLQVLSLEDNRFKPLMDQFFQSLRKESEKP